jgi:hypothetical protein
MLVPLVSALSPPYVTGEVRVVKSILERSISVAILCAVPFACLGADTYPNVVGASWAHYGPANEGYRLGVNLCGTYAKESCAQVFLLSTIIPQGLDRTAFISDAEMSFEFIDDRGNLLPTQATFYDTKWGQSLSYLRIRTIWPTFLGLFTVLVPHHPLAPGHYQLRLRMGLQFVDDSYVELTSGAWNICNKCAGSDGMIVTDPQTASWPK